MVSRNKFFHLFLFAKLALSGSLQAQQATYIFDGSTSGFVGSHAAYLEDEVGLRPEQALRETFTPFSNTVQSLSNNPKAVWVKLDITNRSDEPVGAKIDLASYDLVDWYLIDNGTFIDSAFMGELRIDQRSEDYIEHSIFPLGKLRSGFTNTILLRLVNTEQIVIPLRVDKLSVLQGTNSSRRFVFGIYTGIMLVMFLYNIFLACLLYTSDAADE